MTTLADLAIGEAFLLLARIGSIDMRGIQLQFFGPDAEPQGSMFVSPDGIFSGSIQLPANLIPVTRVPAMATVSVGDVFVDQNTGETRVARLVEIQPDGSFKWSSSIDAANAVYSPDGWTKIGHIDL